MLSTFHVRHMAPSSCRHDATRRRLPRLNVSLRCTFLSSRTQQFQISPTSFIFSIHSSCASHFYRSLASPAHPNYPHETMATLSACYAFRLTHCAVEAGLPGCQFPSRAARGHLSGAGTIRVCCRLCARQTMRSTLCQSLLPTVLEGLICRRLMAGRSTRGSECRPDRINSLALARTHYPEGV